MTHLTADADPRLAVDEFTPDTANRVRTSRQRVDRLREFIRSHLPPHLDIEVIITPHVATAAVLPAEIDAILGSGATDVDRQHAEYLLDGVDADYIVFVTGNAAALDRVPLNDQLTADHAHQFGLAFHELLHILKTAIVAIGQLMEEEVAEQYHEQVHDLINIIEDGAIEREAIQGENFSDNAGIRLELTRRIHSQTPEDIPDDQQIPYSFWDAVTSTLYDTAIYPTGITDVLLDPDDDRIVFKSDADQQAFEAVRDDLQRLAKDALAIKSADPNDTTHSYDKHASVRRANHVIETWNAAIQPILENQQIHDHQQDVETRQAADPSTGQEVQDNEGHGHLESEQSEADLSTDHDLGVGESTEPVGGDGNGPGEAVGPPPESITSSLPDDFDPQDVSVDREATDNPYQDVFEHPEVTPDPELEAVGTIDDGQLDTGGPSEGGDSKSDERGEEPGAGVDPSFEDVMDSESPVGDDTETLDGHSHEQVSQSHAQALAEAAERAREKEGERGGFDIGQETERDQQVPGNGIDAGQHGPQSSTASSRDQLTFDDIGSTSPSDTSEGEPDGRESAQREQDSSETDLDQHVPDVAPSSPSPRENIEAKPDTESEPIAPAHARSSARSSKEEQETYENALDADRQTAHDEATREGIDQTALNRELEKLRHSLDRERRRRDDNAEPTGSNQGGPGNLDEIELLPIVDEMVPPREWAAIEDGAHQVAGTLEKELRLERQRGERVGLTAGTYDTRAGHRLAIGDPGVCKTRMPGREKRYCLVLVLDRSGSMRNGSPPKIEVATQALARFAVAAEGLGIEVGVIDFIHGRARLVKPFSVEARHVQATLLDTACGGGTPLADAIGLARTLVESHRDEPLIITVTDDEPRSVDAVIEQIRESHAPVCSLTIATDCPPGTLSPEASELSGYYERQTAVYTPEGLDDRLDQFASLLVGF